MWQRAWISRWTKREAQSIQRAALKAAGCEVIRAEKVSGARRDGRTELRVLLDFLRDGDTLVVTRIDLSWQPSPGNCEGESGVWI